ncbi:hypothetical protein [Lysobacter gummosus]|uniref:hypothetical protein n=1 Tax=Lysobacter gummosus TaxID=262324 RepID=UPI00363DE1C4
MKRSSRRPKKYATASKSQRFRCKEKAGAIRPFLLPACLAWRMRNAMARTAQTEEFKVFIDIKLQLTQS